MSNLIRKILKNTADLSYWQVLIKSNFNLANLIGHSADLKLEELNLERTELLARDKLLVQKQRSVQSMLTDLTRSIKQMEFDIVQMQKPMETETVNTEQPEPERKQSQQKI